MSKKVIKVSKVLELIDAMPTVHDVYVQELRAAVIAKATSIQKSKREREEELSEICERTHFSCDGNCPVFAVNNEVPDTAHDFNANRGCDCFKNGKAMLKFLKKNK